MPTPLSRAILAAGALSVLLGGAMGSMPAVVAGSAILLFLFSRAAIFLSAEKQVIRTLSIERRCDSLIVRQFGMVTVDLRVHLDLPDGCRVVVRDNPGPGFEVVGDFPEVDPEITPAATYRIRATARGTVSFHGAVAELADPFFSTRIAFSRTHDTAPSIKVQPRGSPVVLSGEGRGYGDATSRRLISPTGTITRSFREYIPGDDPRQIDWKVTAKTNRLTIREVYAQGGEIPVVVLDIPLDPLYREQLIGFAAGATEVSLRTSHSVSFLAVAGGNVIRFLPDERQAARVLAAIRDLPPSSRETQFYRYASEADLKRVALSLSPDAPLRSWYDAAIRIRGIPSFEAECIRAFAGTKGTAIFLFSAAEGDTSHIGMVARAAKRIGLSVHLRIPSHRFASILSGAYPIDSIEVI